MYRKARWSSIARCSSRRASSRREPGRSRAEHRCRLPRAWSASTVEPPPCVEEPAELLVVPPEVVNTAGRAPKPQLSCVSDTTKSYVTNTFVQVWLPKTEDVIRTTSKPWSRSPWLRRVELGLLPPAVAMLQDRASALSQGHDGRSLRRHRLFAPGCSIPYGRRAAQIPVAKCPDVVLEPGKSKGT